MLAPHRALLLLSALAFLSVACSKEPAEEVIDDNRSSAGTVDAGVLNRLAQLPLGCINKEYPNKISHVLSSADDVAAPSELTPAFYGCFDWHSSVHGHWLLVRTLRTHPETPLRDAIYNALSQSFTNENITAELAYVNGPDRVSFERPYGIAWFFQLVAELHESTDPAMAGWRKTLAPLEQELVTRTEAWLQKLAYPIRLGTHNQSAFAFGLMLDYARATNNSSFEALLKAKSLEFHGRDKDCPIDYEPSGEDFLSPCLMEADLMRRIFSRDDYVDWLDTFLPQIPKDGSASWLEPGIVFDSTDGKLVHLDGLNLSRAWALQGIASALPKGDPRVASLLAAADEHSRTGLASVSNEHYAGSHWLASFAMYLSTQRGVHAKFAQ